MIRQAQTVMAFAALCLTLALAAPTDASAQVISQTDQSGTRAGTFIGQSFTANFTGNVTQIAVVPSSGGAASLYFYNGPGTGVSNAAGAPVSSQSVTLVASGGFQVITLSTPLPVINGQTYSFAFGSANLTISAFGNAHPGGGFFSSGTSFAESTADLTFQIFNTLPPAPVPSMSEWAMILLGVILAGGAAIHLQRRRPLGHAQLPS